MARRYGPADYDPDEVPTWTGISRSIDEYIAYNNYYPYRFPEGYRIPPELMQRAYTSDMLLQEAAAAVNQQIEEVAETVNMGIDGAVDSVNEGVDAVMDGANDVLSAGADEITSAANGALESVMDTKHGTRNEEGEPGRDGEVYSTAHEKTGDAAEREVTGHVSLVNKGIDELLQAEEDEPTLTEAMGNAAWQVGSGLTAWAESVQRGRYSTAHGNTEHAGKTSDSQMLGAEPEGDKVYSTSHAGGYTPAVADAQEERTPYAEYAAEVAGTGVMTAAFLQHSPRQTYELAEYQRLAEKQKMTEPVKAKMPEEIAKIQEERFKMSLELIANIDFGAMFQKDFGMGMG